MAPREQFWAFKNMRHNNLNLVAIYHSHPESPARPSQSDIRLAYDPEPSYLLVSLQQRDKPDVRAYRIVEGNVTEEAVEIV
jgi:proteasome lid subunit RPN8/RPN11